MPLLLSNGTNNNINISTSNTKNSSIALEESTTEKELILFTEELERFEKILSKYERGEVPHVSWLDKMTFSRIQEMRKARLEELEEMADYVELHVEFPSVRVTDRL